MKMEKKLFLLDLKHLQKILKVCMLSTVYLTARGGMTSHAAVVARGMGTCCVAGCGEIKINEE